MPCAVAYLPERQWLLFFSQQLEIIGNVDDE
jgi:hypothetical protein